MGLLFSKHTDQSTHIKYPEKVIHEERRAPTDDSIRLAKEYEEAIEKKIIEKLMVSTNIVDFGMIISEDPLRKYLQIKININGREYDQKFDLYNPNIDKLFEKIKYWIADKILLGPLEAVMVAHCSKYPTGFKHIVTHEKEKQ
jgi:hypothetical protein